MRFLILFGSLVFSVHALGLSVAGDAASGDDTKSCIRPAGKLAQACKDLSEAMNNDCVKSYLDKFQEKASSGAVKDAGEWCSNSSTLGDKTKFRSLALNFFGATVACESSGDPNSANAAAPNGVAKGYFQMDAKSANQYQCCKGITDADFKDGKKAAVCGIGANLENMLKGDCWASGNGGSGDKNNCGAAKYQEVLRQVLPKDQETRAQIQACTKKACSDPSRVQDFGGGSTVAELFSTRMPASVVCEN